MPGFRARARRLLVTALAASLLAGCGARVAAPAALRIALASEPAGGELNSMTTIDQSSLLILNQTMEGLTRLGGDGSPTPGIAASWQISPDGSTYTFHLRAARWQNGDPVTAGDFVWAWKQVLDPRNRSQYAGQLAPLAGAADLIAYNLPDPTADPAAYQAAGPEIDALLAKVGVSAPDDRTLVVTLAKPTGYFLSLTAFPTYFPADAAVVSAWGLARYGTEARYTLSDGPFEVKSWVHDDHIDLVRNPRYWDAATVRLAAVHFAIISDASTLTNLFDTGLLDLLPDIPSQYVARYQGKPGFGSQPEAECYYLQFNLKDAVLGNSDIRQALSLAVDRTSYAATVVGGNVAPAFALVPQSVPYAPGKTGLDLVGRVLPLTAQPAQARADLARGLSALGLSALPKIVLLVSNSTGAQTQAAALQAFWKQNLGISVAVQAVDAQTRLADMNSGDYQVAIAGWGADYDDPLAFLSVWTSDSALNTAGYSDAAYDQDIAAAAAQTDPQTRGGDLAAAERELLTALPIAPLYWPTRNWIAAPQVQGLTFYVTGPDYSLKGVTT